MSLNHHTDKLLEFDTVISKLGKDTQGQLAQAKKELAGSQDTALKEAELKFGESLRAVEEKFAATIKTLDEKIVLVSGQVSSLFTVSEKLAAEAAKPKVEEAKSKPGERPASPPAVIPVTIVSPPQISSASPPDVTASQKATQEADAWRAEMDRRMRQLQRDVEAVKAREDSATSKEEMERITQMLMNSKKGSEEVKLEGMGASLKDDTAIELYKRYVVLSKELDRFKQLVVSGFKGDGKEDELQTIYESYERRIRELEQLKERVDSEAGVTPKKQDSIMSAIRAIQKVIADKLKVKIGLEGSTDLLGREEPSHGMVMSSSKSVTRTEEHVQKRSLLAQQTMSGRGLTKEDQVAELEDQIMMLGKEVAKCAPKEPFEKLEQTVKYLQNALASKADRVKLETLEAHTEERMGKLEAETRTTATFVGAVKTAMLELQASQRTGREEIVEFAKKIEKFEENLTAAKFALDDLATKLEQRASSTEVMILKQSLNESAFWFHSGVGRYRR